MTPRRAEPRVGIYGGTFNPIHLGHLRSADEVAETLGLERVLFVPNARPPHKRDLGSDAIAPAHLRLEWVRLAVRDNPRFDVDTIELDRPGPSFLVETLREIGARTPSEPPAFVLGCDAFAELGAWREPEALLTLAHFAVTTRPPQDGTLADWLPSELRGDVIFASDGRSGTHRTAGTWIRQIEVTSLDISASAIRERVGSGGSVRYLLPESVRAAVLASGCYTTGGGERAPDARAQRAQGPQEERA